MTTTDKLAEMEAIAGKIADEFSTQEQWAPAGRVDFEYDGIKFYIDTRDKANAYTFNALQPRIPYPVNTWEADEKWGEIVTKINVGRNKTPDQIAADFKRRFDFAALNECYMLFYNAEAKHEQNRNEHDALAEKVVKTIRPLSEFAHKRDEFTTEISLYDFSDLRGKVVVSHDTVRFEVTAESIESIDRLCKAVASLR